MVRWRLCLLLAMLLVIPNKGNSKLDDLEDESHVDDSEEADDDDEDDDDDDEAAATQKLEHLGVPMIGRRVTAPPTARSTTTEPVTRTVSRRPLECYVCAYKTETKLQSCLDPSKHRVHTMVCHSADDKCFMSVISKGNTYEAVVRGCRSGCVQSSETTCCESSQCNNQPLALPVTAVTEFPPAVRQALKKSKFSKSKCNKAIQSSVVFFVTILLVLQTVVKVAFV